MNDLKRAELRVLLRAINVQRKTYLKDSLQQFFDRALELCRELKDGNDSVYSIRIFARSSQDAGNYPIALQKFLTALNIYKEKKDSSAMSNILYLVGRLYYEEQDYKQALAYLYNAKFVAGRRNMYASMFSHTRIGMTYVKLHKYDSARLYAEKAYAIGREYYKNNIFGGLLNDIGLTYFDMGEDSLALNYLERSYLDLINNGDDVNVCETTLGLANVFKKIGKMDSSIYYVRQTLWTAQKRGILKYISDASSLLTDYFKNKNQIDSAFFYQQIGIAAYDSLYNQEKVSQFQNLTLAEQQRQLDIASAKKAAEVQYRYNLKMYALAAALLIFLLIASILGRNNRQRRRAYNLLQKQKQEIDIQKARVEKALDDLKATQSQLIQSEKMASLGELTAGIAHEIQNPLNFVNNFSEVNKELLTEMKDEIDKGNFNEVKSLAKDVTDNEEKIIFHGKRADAIVKSMLQHSRASSGKKEPTDINVLADEYLRLAYHGLRAKDKSFNATMKTNYDETIGKINIISQDIGRVILNLITNAFYSVAEKRKRVGESYDPVVSVSTKRSLSFGEGRGEVQISVKDNGDGIPQKVLDKIFQPFFTTKPTGQGTGLGLSLSYDIIKAHGGTLKVNTKEKEFAEFIILLPL